jgi:chemotaxis receptor (MCP) glutamine deamidase CheD|tara:strand:+ start:194 stop:751 length:558 start_codon:yes stop_codon:yes gene_type:complete
MPNNIFDEMTNDASQEIATEISIENLSKLAAQIVELESVIATKETELNEEKAKYRRLTEEILPSKMEELGISEFKLADGTKINLSRFYSAKITDENRQACFKYLEDNGLGDVIKNTVTANFGRGEDDTANSLANRLEKEGFTTQTKKWVEPMTLKAVVREQVESGNDLPLETFNVYIGQKVKVKK